MAAAVQSASARYRGRPSSVRTLERLGRERLSKHFFMRDFLQSEIAQIHGLLNAPDDPALAIEAGRRFADAILEPLVETFGPIAVRSAYRSPEVNETGQRLYKSCASNVSNRGRHTWDRRDEAGRMGAMASIVIPWFADRYEAGRDWRDLAWWLHGHLNYHAIQFFPKRAAFNIGWREDPDRTISSYVAPRGILLRADTTPDEPPEARRARHADFPPFRGIRYPE